MPRVMPNHRGEMTPYIQSQSVFLGSLSHICVYSERFLHRLDILRGKLRRVGLLFGQAVDENDFRLTSCL